MTSETKYFGSPLDSDSFKFKGFGVTSSNIRGLDIFDPSRSITPAPVRFCEVGVFLQLGFYG